MYFLPKFPDVQNYAGIMHNKLRGQCLLVEGEDYLHGRTNESPNARLQSLYPFLPLPGILSCNKKKHRTASPRRERETF